MDAEVVTITLQEMIKVVGDVGILGLLAMVVWSFYRGDVLSRKVYQELTESILDRFCTRLVRELREVIRETANEVAERMRVKKE